MVRDSNIVQQYCEEISFYITELNKILYSETMLTGVAHDSNVAL